MNMLNQAAGLGSLGSSRPTPAEDVCEALSRLNSAVRAAAKAGWNIALTIEDNLPSFAGEGASFASIRATIQKQV